MKLARARKIVFLTTAAAVILVLAAFSYYSRALLFGTRDVGTGADSREETAIVSVSGMTCDHCALQVRNALVNAPGVKSADVSYTRGEAVVVFDPNATNPDAIRDTVNATGFRAGEVVSRTTQSPRPNLATAFIFVEGVSDGARAAAVRRTLGGVGGVSSVEVNEEREEARVIDLRGGGATEVSLEGNEVKVSYDPELVAPGRITAAIEAAGFSWIRATFIPPE